MNPHMVVKLVPSACWLPPRVTQFELAPGKLPMADSLLLDRRCASGLSLARSVHLEPSNDTPSHFGWNDEQISTHVVKSKASSLSRTSPSILVLQRTVNC